jgi:hypothetical protein
MAIQPYVGNHKEWDHVGSITPDFEISEGVRPAEEFKPAAWLPVGRYDKHYEEYFVISAGKIVALDNDGRVVPAQYADGDVDVVYTAEDVAAGTIDVTTGVAVTGAVTYGVDTVDGTPGFMGRTGEAMAVSNHIGVAPYNYWQWAGGDGFNPAQYRKHNHNLQHQVAVLCDYYVELPLVPLLVAAEDLSIGTQDAGGANIYDFTTVGLDLAKNTARTPITFEAGAATAGDVALVLAADRFIDEVASRAGILVAGDYYIDYATGLISVYGTAAQSVDFNAGAEYAIVAYTYSAGTAPSTYASAIGDLQPGQFVKADVDSNYIFWDTSADKIELIVGQILAVDDRFPKDALDKVRTAYAGLGVEKQMPGSANGGVPANISYSGAANAVVRINLINR